MEGQGWTVVALVAAVGSFTIGVTLLCCGLAVLKRPRHPWLNRMFPPDGRR